MENNNENIIQTYLSWNEDLDLQIQKLRDLDYHNFISFQNDVLTIIYNDILVLPEEEVCKKYNLQNFEINKIRCVKTNFNAEGKNKGKKWLLGDEIKVKNWMMNPNEKSYQELCSELERSGIAIEARIIYLLERELFISSESVDNFCKKFNINLFTYHYVTNQTLKIEKKEEKENDNNKEEEKEKEMVHFMQPKWTSDEEKFLKVIIKNGKTVKEIAELLKRSVQDVEQRIRILIYKEMEDQIQNWSKTYKMSINNVLSMCSYQIKKMNDKIVDKSSKKIIKKEDNDVDNVNDNEEDLSQNMDESNDTENDNNNSKSLSLFT